MSKAQRYNRRSVLQTAAGGVLALGASKPSLAEEYRSFAKTNSEAVNSAKKVNQVTNLLFPFVSNMSTFDTGITIANTSKDPFGTKPQSGSVTLHAFPQGGGTPITHVATADLCTGRHVGWELVFHPGFGWVPGLYHRRV